ncbi:uncharacterized protein LOC123273822 isoform X2 [Cotesia glomerata]|uniref:uncharacterized protein LOC123273821 isoform X2 n=1 Tax=Cotesia glomerata TaxID=32391 RepID=UPI001D026921|nr:uncharacterized protein LOC123273821 isoform X2 [Cotesia glomerata]XP_044597236.1 uncharacterized protein LOC123273822 isoform X2 [Cotesia glomerata]
MWTRIQERLLLRSRLMTLERLFQYESWYEMNRPDYEKWTKIAENSGLIGKKSVSECWRHFCELYHTFKYHKGVSKRGEPIEPWEYYDTFNHYYHVCLDREDARWRAIRAARYAHAGDSDDSD